MVVFIRLLKRKGRPVYQEIEVQMGPPPPVADQELGAIQLRMMESPPQSPANEPGAESMNEDETPELEEMETVGETAEGHEMTDHEMEDEA